MTNTHSQCRTVVTAALLAAAFLSLSGCGGGGGGGLVGSPKKSSYVAIAFGERDRGTRNWRQVSSARSAPSSAEAQRLAERGCAELLGQACHLSIRGTTGCAALAVSTCGYGCSSPAVGMVASPTLAGARSRALALCRSNNIGTSEVCRISTNDNGEQMALCGSG